MILNGVKLLVAPARSWRSCSGAPHSPKWLLGAALTAVIFPAFAVVAGHLGSSMLGFEARDTAIQRAAVGLVSAVGGALVMAPALALVLMSTSQGARAPASDRAATSAAMGILWPAWMTGLVLAAPPLLGLGPNLGEILWLVFATAVTARTLRAAASPALSVRRRWAPRFFWRTEFAFAILFALIAVAPAVAARNFLGVEGVVTAAPPEPVSWPLPPSPNW